MDTYTQKISLSTQLASFGLDEIEAKIYLFLLNRPPQSVLQVSRALNLARTTVYDNSLKLISQGFVEKVIKYKSQMLKASPLSILETKITQEKAKIESLEKTYKNLSTVLTQSLSPNTTTQVRYYHGKHGFQQMMWNALSAKKEHIGYSELGRVEVVGQKFLENWMQEMIERKITDRVIIANKSETFAYIKDRTENEFRKKYQNTRVLNTSFLISGDTTIYNNVFAVAWWKQGEVVGVEIENPELVKTQKAIFEILWKQAKPLHITFTKT